ncbi:MULTISPECIES: sigma-70 family RNA polymerase sigma factor [Clostridium]|jgi:RNA polymerase sigma factor (sigma-70 family)|uniref:sigma-70 family RNA polymerase sigma factor n=1 Tax=Clostridium TaxID=1485 RepID=UPI000E9349E0|nr:sigma-70 family RNA polymerase sigma factor [Clostridium tyrobutyricum]HBF78256.1 hypothetical protein [Clostridiaceae bacterium]
MERNNVIQLSFLEKSEKTIIKNKKKRNRKKRDKQVDNIIQITWFDTIKNRTKKSNQTRVKSNKKVIKKIEKEDTVSAIRKYQLTKDPALLNSIVKDNYNLIYYTIKRYHLDSNTTIDQDDLLQEGAIGLIKAIEKFDAKKKCEFSTYAIIYIKSYIINYIKVNSNGSVAVSLHGIDLMNKYRKNEDDIKDSKLKGSLKVISNTPILMDAPVKGYNKDSMNFEETLSDENEVEFANVDFKLTWQKISLDLTEKQKTIIEYYIQGYHWNEISKKMHSSPQAVSISGKRAFKMLKEKYGNDLKKMLCS